MNKKHVIIRKFEARDLKRHSILSSITIWVLKIVMKQRTKLLI